MTIGPRSRTSPSSAILTDVPGIGRPTEPTRCAPIKLRVAPAVVSVNPYPSRTVTPAPR